MTSKKTLILALALVAGVSAAGIAAAQSTRNSGADMPGGMHRGMHGEMQASMHGMGGMHGGMPGMPGGGHGQGPGHAQARPAGDDSAASLAFAAANEKMHRDMAIAYSGDADVDFARGMVPHHQGAIDMAKIVLAFGKDPEIRKLAEEIIRAQEGEIAFLRDWLEKRGQ